MAYVASSEGAPIDPDRLRAMGEAVGLTIPAEDIEPLSTAVRDQLASIAQLDRLDLEGIAPILRFDPRWHD